MNSGYAVVLGEALIDLVEGRCGDLVEGKGGDVVEGQGGDVVDRKENDLDEAIYRPMVGGAPLNVAVGLARLGVPAHLLTAIGPDVLGGRIRTFLVDAGVQTEGCVATDRPTTLAVTSLRDAEPEFHFYGEPPSYAAFGAEHIDAATVGEARALYCGSIALLCDGPLAAARSAWAISGPVRVFDPNVRPALLGDPAGLRAIVEEFAATADLVKLSEPDARELFDLDPAAAAEHLREVGAGVVVVTRAARGALLAVGDERLTVPAPTVRVRDTTGAGDAAMAGLIAALVEHGVPATADLWRELVVFATQVAALCCERPGGATAMPTRAELAERFPAP